VRIMGEVDILSIDPGLKNTCATLMTLSRIGESVHVEVIWSTTGNFDGQVKPDKEKAWAFFCHVQRNVEESRKGRDHVPFHVVVEFQVWCSFYESNSPQATNQLRE